MLNPLSQPQIAIITLWYLVQHSLSTFYKLTEYFGSATEAIQPHHLTQWPSLGLHKNHLQRLAIFQTSEGQLKFHQLLEQIEKFTDFVLTFEDADYPQQLQTYDDKPPILFGLGTAQHLLQPQIAIVGSRKPSPHGRQVAYDFAYYLSDKGFYINSGLAQGIDEAAHNGALQHQRTIAVMGTGLDLTYPHQNTSLRQKILENDGTIISEFLMGTPPLQHHFPRRNRIVSALSLGVVVAEATLKSGSLITAKLAAEQGKLVFAIPGHIYSEHHQGCHQLIREGAILIDHPEQIIEDLALPTQWQSTELSKNTNLNISTDSSDLPSHLTTLYNQLDWIGQNIDSLAITLNIEISELTSLLMELELLGLIMQQGGLYLRCRPLK